jgi:hypothetical protein
MEIKKEQAEACRGASEVADLKKLCTQSVRHLPASQLKSIRRFHSPGPMPSNTTFLILLFVLFAFCLSQNGVYAFGAGNIPSYAQESSPRSELTLA